MLSRGLVLRVFVRNRSVKKHGTIRVQLLKDIENVGVAGEILKVRAGYMRNFLHHDNKACYIKENQGPRIPVAESTRRVERKKKTVKLADDAVEPTSAPKPLSLKELSGIFSSMRKTPKIAAKDYVPVTANVETTSSEATFSLVELEENILPTFIYNPTAFPVSKTDLIEAIYASTGIEVPVTALRIRDISNTHLQEIPESGEYTWIFQVPGNPRTLKRILRVN